MPSVTGEAFYRENYIPDSKKEPTLGAPLKRDASKEGERVPAFTPDDFTITSGWAVYKDKGDDRTTVKGDLVGFYYDSEDAEDAARGHGWYGGNGVIEKTFALKINDDSYFLLIQPEPVPIDVNLAAKKEGERKAALRKLTAKERELLGLPDPDVKVDEDEEDD